jgi:hypothetical protein
MFFDDFTVEPKARFLDFFNGGMKVCFCGNNNFSQIENRVDVIVICRSQPRIERMCQSKIPFS